MVLDFAREGPTVEWKSELPKNGGIKKSLCALANGTGGTIWIGVDDTGCACGLRDVEATVLTLEAIAREELDPPLELTLSRVRAGGLQLLRVEVPVAAGGLVEVVAKGERRVYVRDGTNSRPASQAEVRALARSRDTKVRIDAESRRLLTALAGCQAPTRSELGRKARFGTKALKRALTNLLQAGLVLERADRRLWITPGGHRVLASKRS